MKAKLIKTKSKSFIHDSCYSFGRMVCAGAVVLIASTAQAQTLFVVDSDIGSILEFTPSGSQSTFFSENPNPVIAGLAFNSAGNLFVGVPGNGDIYEFTPGGGQSIFASGLVLPGGLAFNSEGDLFATDWSGKIFEFTPGGVQSTFASGLGRPSWLAFNAAGDLFESDDLSGNIYEFTPGGVKSTFATGLYDSGLNYIQGLAFDSTGNLFAAVFFGSNNATQGTGVIYKFTPGGTRSTFASGLNAPVGLAFNNAGDLFVADFTAYGHIGDGSIYEFTPSGTRSTFASGINPDALAFQGVTLPVPEPSSLGLMALSVTALLARRRHRNLATQFSYRSTA